jgi:hypothetical protein
MAAALTLWRGEKLVGELLKKPDSRDGSIQRADRPTLSAFLRLSPDAPPLDSVWQIRPFFGMGVQHESMEPLVHGEPDPEIGKYPSSGALEPMPPEKVAGVPREVQLTVRDQEGRTWLPRQIWLREIRYRPEDMEKVRREVPVEALVANRLWLLFAAFDSDTGVPDT